MVLVGLVGLLIFLMVVVSVSPWIPVKASRDLPHPNTVSPLAINTRHTAVSSWLINRSHFTVRHKTLYKIRHKFVTDRVDDSPSQMEISLKKHLYDANYVAARSRGHSLCTGMKVRKRRPQHRRRLPRVILEVDCKKSCKRCVRRGGQYRPLLYAVPVFVQHGDRKNKMYTSEIHHVAVDCLCIKR